MAKGAAAAFGAADVGAAFGAADVGLGLGADVGLGLGADAFAATSAIPAAGDLLGGAALAPDLTLGGLDAAAAIPSAGDVLGGDLLGGATLAPELTAGADITGAIPAAGDLLSGQAGFLPGTFFGGESGDLFSGVGMGGDFGNVGTAFGDPFSSFQGGVSSFGPDTGSFAPGNLGGAADLSGGGADLGGLQAPGATPGDVGASTAPTSDSMFLQNEGIVNPGQIQGTTGDFASRFNAAFPGSSAPELASPSAETLGAMPSTAGEFPTVTDQFLNPQLGGVGPGGSFSGGGVFDPGNFDPATFAPTQSVQNTLTGVPENITTGADFTGSQLNTMAGTPLTDVGGTISPTGGVMPASEAFGPTAPATVAGTPAAPAATPATATPAATPAGPAAPSAPATTTAATAGGGAGVNPLSALRGATTGLNALTAGVRLANALNQPSMAAQPFTALLPGAFPGSPFAPVQNVGFGGIAGGLAANRLTNSLVAGATAQQLAASGIISLPRAQQLQADYNGIAAQYARQLGISPQRLSPQIKQMIAARALADQGLGGR